jgi:hypothetical protein
LIPPQHPTDLKGTPTIRVPYSNFFEKDKESKKKAAAEEPKANAVTEAAKAMAVSELAKGKTTVDDDDSEDEASSDNTVYRMMIGSLWLRS